MTIPSYHAPLECLLAAKTDPATGAEVMRIAHQIMQATDGEQDALLVGAALLRAVAGFWAAMAVAHGDEPAVADQAVREVMAQTGVLAGQLVYAHYEEWGEPKDHELDEGTAP